MSTSYPDSNSILEKLSSKINYLPQDIFSAREFLFIDYQNFPASKIQEHEVPMYTLEITDSSSECLFQYEVGDFTRQKIIRGQTIFSYPQGTSYKATLENGLDRISLLGIETHFIERILRHEFGICDMEMPNLFLSNADKEHPIFSFIETFRKSLIFYPHDTCMHRDTLSALTKALIYELMKDKKRPMNPKKELLEQIKAYIECNWRKEKNFKTGDLPKSLETDIGIKIQTHEIYSLFKEYDLITPGIFLRNLQINYIINRLFEGAQIKTLVRELHYKDRSNLNKKFKRNTGINVTPKQIKCFLSFMEENQKILANPDISKEMIRDKVGFDKVEDLDKVMMLIWDKDFIQYRKSIQIKK
ncbi:MAG: hypothetical protein F6K41_07165 [Symploca sp. SIO3E6]|nr:hypothetical protein [Caldora sp. SIO3E6]